MLSLVFTLRRKCVSVSYVVNNNAYSMFCKYEAPCCPGLHLVSAAGLLTPYVEFITAMTFWEVAS